MALLGLTLCLLPALVTGQALPLTVGEMRKACAAVAGEGGDISPEGAIAAGACFGAIRGVVQVMQANCRSVTMGQRPAMALTVGEIPEFQDAVGAFGQWADANPAEADAPAEYGIIVALAEAFPCSPSGGD